MSKTAHYMGPSYWPLRGAQFSGWRKFGFQAFHMLGLVFVAACLLGCGLKLDNGYSQVEKAYLQYAKTKSDADLETLAGMLGDKRHGANASGFLRKALVDMPPAHVSIVASRLKQTLENPNSPGTLQSHLILASMLPPPALPELLPTIASFLESTNAYDMNMAIVTLGRSGHAGWPHFPKLASVFAKDLGDFSGHPRDAQNVAILEAALQIAPADSPALLELLKRGMESTNPYVAIIGALGLVRVAKEVPSDAYAVVESTLQSKSPALLRFAAIRIANLPRFSPEMAGLVEKYRDLMPNGISLPQAPGP